MNQNEKSRTIKIDIRTLAYTPKSAASKTSIVTAESVYDAIDYRFLFEHAYDAILLISRTGHVLGANARAARFFGYTEEQLTQLMMPALVAGVDDDLLSTIQSTICEGKYVRIKAFGILSSGDFSAIEIAVTGSGQNSENQFCCLIRNIQSGWQTEQNLNSAYHAMDNTDAGIGIVNMDGIFTYANRMMIKLLAQGNEQAVLGAHMNTWFDQTTVVEPIFAGLVSRRSWTGEQWLMTGGEKSSWLTISAVPDINSDDELCGIVIAIRDTADKRRAEIAEQQTARNRVIMESFSSICHALGQPATVLLTSIELLRLNSGLDDTMKAEVLDLCYDAALEMREQLGKMSTRCTDTELAIRTKEV